VPHGNRTDCTIAENVAIPLILQHRDWDAALSEAARNLEIVGPKDGAQLPPVKLSGGEHPRVAIVRAIVSRPDILILEEPSLDGDTGRNIVRVRGQILSGQRPENLAVSSAQVENVRATCPG